MSVDINDICIISYQICYIINRYHSFCYLLAEIEELGDPDQPLKLVRVERRCVEEVIFDHDGGDNDHGDKDPEFQNVNFFAHIISVQLNLPQEKVRKSRQVFDI